MEGVAQIRIGMIQGAEQISFTVEGPHRIENERGETLLESSETRSYRATVADVTPGKLEYWVRVGIRERGRGAELAEAWKERGFSPRVETLGRLTHFGGSQVDNREDWVLVGPFENAEAAEQFRRAQETPGELAVLEWVVERPKGTVALDGQAVGSVIRAIPRESEEPHIWLDDVLIGIEFHWQHREREHLRGLLEVNFNRYGQLLAINELPLESYLASVNSSEMTGDSPEELLKAQTVAARSTIFATAGKHHFNEPFDLCADDHCQCYYGAQREMERSWQAVRATWGEVLTSGGLVCDARYSKICGGIIEDYRYVWDNRVVPYLISGIDGTVDLDYPANTEEKARKLIDSSPDVYCNVDRYELPESLRDRCAGLFRWEVSYTPEELGDLIQRKTGVRVGQVLDLVPLERGDSGRIVYLDVLGSERKLRLGKELEIRRALSESHLYSSLFYVEKQTGPDGKVTKFVLHGAGWGHGVGLCQVGATVMAQKGFDYKEILFHYYKNTSLERLY